MTDAETAQTRHRAVRADLIGAAVLAAILSVGWAITDWTRLSRLLLPDPDDMMRLLQVRDWIAGQGINDWTQYRLEPPTGALMHWSRVADVGIAAIILAATPFVGQYDAEIVAVLLYPALLFATALFLSARIARRLWGRQAALIAIVLTAIAYPGATVFVPGRIDHHALQVVLIQLLVLLSMRSAALRTGIATGAVAAISLVVGLESTPQVAAIVTVVFCLWASGRTGERERLAGLSIGLASVTLVFLIFLRPTFWSDQYCDAFTPASSTATLAGAAALGALAALDPILRDWRWRTAVGMLLGAGALGATLLAYPACVNGPYGAVDPVLRGLFYPHIVEANGVFAQGSMTAAAAVAGVVVAGCVASVWMIARAPRRWPQTAPVVAVLWMSALVMVDQVRGGYVGAPLAAPILAGLVVAARARKHHRTLAVIGAWLASAGPVYLHGPKSAAALVTGSRAATPTGVQLACTVGDTWAQVDRYPAGAVITGTNAAANLIGSTHHATIGAGYHRNNAGNMAVYRFFLGRPERSRAIARQWKVDYVAFCPGDFDEVEAVERFPASLAVALRGGRPPAWLQPLPLRDTPLRFYRVVAAH